MFNFRGTLIFFFSAFILSMTVEVLFRFVATNNPKAFGFALMLYPIFFVFTWIIAKIGIRSRIGNLSKIFGYTTYYFISGIVGLFVFEWFLAGNSPWGNPNANQFSMFSYWALLGFIPKIFSERRDNQIIKSSLIIKKFILIHFIVYVMISLIGGFGSIEGFPRFTWIVWSFIISFSLMNLYVVWFLIKIKRRK